MKNRPDFNLSVPLAGLIGLWFAIATLSNIVSFTNALNLTHLASFDSANFSLMAMTLSRYPIPPLVLKCVFALVILGEGLIAFVFLSSVFKHQYRHLAFSLAAIWWGLFLVADELFIAYHFETTHSLLLLIAIAGVLICRSEKEETLIA